ncbi:interleukin-6 isoform X1 [Artibeus jamaicensis]|uniref:interleukin-6 isoform X1 n=1 Tax=Artibeus jamaicensis TaxID=9417 RepID=UPI00235AF6AB|nr:interleukin-6 isoform X1 [Artibeus jamaicensis]XP_053519572.1 interleukin-6 isoform X1 [Artibeus jamaicensis]
MNTKFQKMQQGPPLTSHQRDTFSPLAFSLGLLLVIATAFPTPVPLGEDSKEETTSKRSPLTSPDQIEKLIKSIMLEISEVKNKMCDNHETCKNSKEALTENNLNLPKLTRRDGCFQSGFNEKTCLTRLTTGLVKFQVYLQYLQNTFEDNAKAMQMRIKALVNILKQKNPDEEATPEPTTDASLLEQMQAQNEWRKTTTIHLILRSLEDFLQFAQRAVRIM